MFKKTLKITIGLFIIGNSAFAQWSSTSTTDPIFRPGSVGIGTTTALQKLTLGLNQPNDGVWLSGNSKDIALLMNTTTGAWNSLTQSGDHLLFWKASGLDDPNAGGLVLGPWTALNKGMRITSAGNVGIGTANPLSTIHMHGGNLGQNAGDRINLLTTANTCGEFNYAYVNIYSYRNATGNSWLTTSTRIENKIDVDSKGYIEFNPNGLAGGLALGTDNTPRLFVSEAGNVGIGTTSNGSFKLAVEGKIGARGVKVTLANPFPDYVFESNYKLRPLANLESYINQNKHLPGIPSAEEVKKDGGIELGEMNVKLLEKVEELTLYILELNKKLADQQKQIERLIIKDASIK